MIKYGVAAFHAVAISSRLYPGSSILGHMKGHPPLFGKGDEYLIISSKVCHACLIRLFHFVYIYVYYKYQLIVKIKMVHIQAGTKF